MSRVENIETQRLADDKGNGVRNSDDDYPDSSISHHALGFIYFAFVTARGDPIETTQEEVEGKRNPTHYSKDHEDVADEFFDCAG